MMAGFLVVLRFLITPIFYNFIINHFLHHLDLKYHAAASFNMTLDTTSTHHTRSYLPATVILPYGLHSIIVVYIPAYVIRHFNDTHFRKIPAGFFHADLFDGCD